jgi:hypothetical protein
MMQFQVGWFSHFNSASRFGHTEKLTLLLVHDFACLFASLARTLLCRLFVYPVRMISVIVRRSEP